MSKISDLKFDDKNFNKHSAKGMGLLEKSLQQYGGGRSILIDKDNNIIAGNGIIEAAGNVGLEDLQIVESDGTKIIAVKRTDIDLNSQIGREMALADNATAAEDLAWDNDTIDEVSQQFDFDPGEWISGWNKDQHDFGFDEDFGVAGSMQDKYGVPPFSILDTRQGNWQEKRQKWLDLGIESERGREDNLLKFSYSVTMQGRSGTSIFDPFLCELMYKWFCPQNGTIIDPFAGGSVRGIVAAKTGHKYLGLELRPEQVEANIVQRDNIIGKDPKRLDWIIGDSNKTLDSVKDKFDMVFSCPPYADLEVYSDDPADLSTMEYDDFVKVYSSIIRKAVSKLKENRFAVFVVGEVRTKAGEYRNFVGDTIKAFCDAGCLYYNELILVNSAGTLPLRAGRVFNSMRKIGKMHQNILVFYKGNMGKIKDDFGEIVSEETEDETIDK
jgi:DNA modification methylase